MKKTKIIMVILCAVIITTTKAQDVHRTFGVGLQSSLPLYGLSVKYAFTNNSVGQATIAPFGIKSDGAFASINFYGLRYIHTFAGNEDHQLIVDPYFFIGTGLINYKYDYTSYGGDKTSKNILSYSAGGGLELLLIKTIGVSFEIGYGKIAVSSTTGANSILGGGGIHYYIF